MPKKNNLQHGRDVLPVGLGHSSGSSHPKFNFLLGTAGLSTMGYEDDRSRPVIRLWNETPHEWRVSPAQARGHREKARR